MRNHHSRRLPRTGSVLLLTLIVVAMLTLGAMAFFERMFAEYRAVSAHGRQLQAKNLAESGIEFMKVVLSQDLATIDQSGGLYSNPSLFQGVLVNDDVQSAFRGRFTLVAPDMTTDGYYSGIRYGLENESSRLNLNSLLLADSYETNGAQKLLLTLPGMTESIADAILDWIDTDVDARPMGAERDYYTALDPPYEPRNGPLHSLEELLLVRDVTPALLFGADLNRNGRVDRNEEAFQQIDNVDNSDGTLDRGWAAYLTLDSAESNLRPDGTKKIDVNMDKLEDLHKQLVEVLDEEMANFIIAYRQGGPFTGDGTAKPASSLRLDFTKPAVQKLTTVLDLIGSKTRVVEKGQQERTVVETPFKNDRASMQSYLPKLMDNLGVNAQPSIPGRLNINQAPRRLLMGVPGLAEVADRIIANRDVQVGPDRPEQQYETWLLMDGVVDLAKMKKLMPLVTSGGSVYRGQIVGFFDSGGPAVRMEAVVDATQPTAPVVRRRWELNELGAGYGPDDLGVPAEDVP